MSSLYKYQPATFEVVERKGIGHPDTLADGISEEISRELCMRYREDFGEIMHHNVDKVLIIGGRSAPRFGGGEILAMPCVIVGGRATSLKGQGIEDVIRTGAAGYLSRTVKNLKEFSIEPRTREGAPELRSLIGHGANDTSIGVGYAPLSRTEALVLMLEEKVLAVRGTGQDNKIMAVKNKDALELVVAASMVSDQIFSMDDYIEAKSRVKDAVISTAEGCGFDATVHVNAADHGDHIFLTVTGTSAEMGDDGATGRGNRGNGLITPMRPMTLEAIAGKNPVIHVGKIYNVMAQKAAEDIAGLDGVCEAYVTLVSKIGSPLYSPLVRAVRVATDDPQSRGDIISEAEAIVNSWLGRTEELVEDFVSGRLTVY